MEGSYALLLESSKMVANFQKLSFFNYKIQFYSNNVCKQKYLKNDKIYLDHAISNMQKFVQNLQYPDVKLRKYKIVKISFDGLYPNTNPFPYVKGFPKS